jgi:hypothetical protein
LFLKAQNIVAFYRAGAVKRSRPAMIGQTNHRRPSYPLDHTVMLALISLTILVLAVAVDAGVQSITSRPGRETSATGQARPGGDEIASWEQLVEGTIENKGVAQIEMFGNRWVLTVQCNGTHQTYLDDPLPPPTQYANRYLRARYHYVQRTVAVACLRPPCAQVRERRISLERVTILSLTPEQATTARQCD